GVKELIQSIGHLQEAFPKIGLLALTALYDSEDSRQYLLECRELIGRLGLHDKVLLDPTFSAIGDVIRRLHACDVIVLPYHASAEGASGAASIGLASKRPLVVSSAEIFCPVAEVVHTLSEVTPNAIALSLSAVLSAPDVLASLQEKTSQYVLANS